MPKGIKPILITALAVFCLFFVFSPVAQAQLVVPNIDDNDVNKLGIPKQTTNFGAMALLFLGVSGFNLTLAQKGVIFSPISKIILSFFSFLGIIFLGLMVYAGLKWMMAGGNEDEVEKARKIIRDSLVGLLVILASFFVVYFILGIAAGFSSITAATSEGQWNWNPLEWTWSDLLFWQ